MQVSDRRDEPATPKTSCRTKCSIKSSRSVSGGGEEQLEDDIEEEVVAENEPDPIVNDESAERTETVRGPISGAKRFVEVWP